MYIYIYIHITYVNSAYLAKQPNSSRVVDDLGHTFSGHLLYVSYVFPLGVFLNVCVMIHKRFL